MGRTLYFDIKPKNGCFSEKELKKLYDVGLIYSERCEWTCENFVIEPYACYPNWESKSTWEDLDRRWNEMVRMDKHPNDVAKCLVKEGIANYHCGHDKPRYGFGGFTKVGGNELNALQVVMGLLAASRVVKNAEIKLYDEGKLIVCNHIKISVGKARPAYDEIQQQIGYLLSKALFDSAYSSYKDEFLASAKELYDIINPKKDDGWHTIGGDWIDIATLLRPIDPKDFEDYPEYNVKQIMAGFGGEYFGLNKTDPEADSYRMVAAIQEILPKDCEIEICQKIKF